MNHLVDKWLALYNNNGEVRVGSMVFDSEEDCILVTKREDFIMPVKITISLRQAFESLDQYKSNSLTHNLKSSSQDYKVLCDVYKTKLKNGVFKP